MYSDLNGVIVGGAIGILGGLSSTLLLDSLKKRKKRHSAKTIAIAEITAIKERTQRLADGRSSFKQFCTASSTLLPITSILSYLCAEQLSAFIEVIVLDKEVKSADANTKPDEASLSLLIEACEHALQLFK